VRPHRSLLLLLAAAPLAAQDSVEHLLASLTLEQKAGQLFMCWSLSRADGQQQQRRDLLAAVRDAGLGGVILSLGSVGDAAELVPQLQAAAAVPLLLAGDFEGGVAFRLSGATDMGNQMLVGATGSPALAAAMGEVTGAEARALGFQWVFAPVLDVNSNPRNPIINVRSFGEDPAAVARLGVAFAAGVHAQGLLATGKHFPGHGDVDTDSHLQLPTVHGDRERLQRVELLPFRAAAAAGLDAVMTGHLAVPGLGEDPTLPATLSTKILGDVLRGELGFRGLVVTDALEMGAVKNAFAPGEVAVRALLAGADVLLMPPDPLAARAAVVTAVQQGRVGMARLDDAVRRILAAKARTGLLEHKAGVDADWRAVVGQPSFQRVGEAIARRGLTLVRDRDGMLPLRKGPVPLLVSLLDADDAVADVALHSRLGAELGDVPMVRLHAGSDAAAVAAALAAIAPCARIVLSLHVAVREYSGMIGLPPALQPVLAALAGKQVVAVSFGNPYLVQQLPQVGAYLCAYAGTPRLERAVAQALLGEAEVTGRLPVSIPGVAAAGSGLSLYPGVDVPSCQPLTEGVDAALPEAITALLQRAVADGAFPGAVCAVARHGRRVVEVAVGKEHYAVDAPVVTVATRYDLASLTKVCATTLAVLRLVADGALHLDDPVGKWVPAFTGADKAAITVRHLLAHCGGLPAHRPYFQTLHGKDAIVAAAAAEPLVRAPGSATEYSDLDYMLLGAVVERCSGRNLADYVQSAVFAPLGMRTAAFAPTDAPPLAAAPTEVVAGREVRGYVHDENAFAMEGVAGHAGLFGTAADVLEVGLCLLGGGRGVLPRSLVDLARQPAGLVAGDRGRGLGLQLLADGGFGGAHVAAGTFGHTGFTGTSLWCDPASDTCVVLLTNRVHPTRANDRIGAVRAALHDLVQAAVGR
jgi:beta-glucosidase-like glycosyl hydrolase/CubicO group peptidase (beta-lactamase class C family)